MRGRLAIWLGQEEFQLRPGDSFYFTSQTPHRWYNPGRTETIILWINTPPTHFRSKDQIRPIRNLGWTAVELVRGWVRAHVSNTHLPLTTFRPTA